MTLSGCGCMCLKMFASCGATLIFTLDTACVNSFTQHWLIGIEYTIHKKKKRLHRLAFCVFGTATSSSLRGSVAVRLADASWTVSTSIPPYSLGPNCSWNVCKSRIATVKTSWLAWMARRYPSRCVGEALLCCWGEVHVRCWCCIVVRHGEHVHRDVFCSVSPNFTASFSLLEIVLLLLCFSFVPISWAPRNFIIRAFIALGPSEGALPRLLVEPNEMKGKPEDPAAQTPCDMHTAIAPDHPWPRGHHVPAEPERARPTMRDEPGTPQNDLNSYWL